MSPTPKFSPSLYSDDVGGKYFRAFKGWGSALVAFEVLFSAFYTAKMRMKLQ